MGVLLALSRKERDYEIRREIRTLQGPDKEGREERGGKGKSLAGRKYGAVFVAVSW